MKYLRATFWVSIGMLIIWAIVLQLILVPMIVGK